MPLLKAIPCSEETYIDLGFHAPTNRDDYKLKTDSGGVSKLHQTDQLIQAPIVKPQLVRKGTSYAYITRHNSLRLSLPS